MALMRCLREFAQLGGAATGNLLSVLGPMLVDLPAQRAEPAAKAAEQLLGSMLAKGTLGSRVTDFIEASTHAFILERLGTTGWTRF